MTSKILNTLTLSIAILLLVSSCVTNNDDAPPVIPFTPGTTKTIAEVKALYDSQLFDDEGKEIPWYDRVPVEITEDISIKGIISADDKTSNGNLYKEGYVQDKTSGLRMTFQSSGGLFVNDSVIINCKGLYLSDYGDFIQLGGDPYLDDNGNNRVAGIDKHKYLKRKVIEGQKLQPIITTIDQVGEEHMAMLIQLNDVQFADNELGKTYAVAKDEGQDPQSANRDLVDCNGNKIIVRSSGYSNFAGTLLPEGKGTFIGIVSKFNTTLQLTIRHFDEIILEGERCSENNEIILGEPVETIDEDFSSVGDNQNINLNGWNNFTTSGSRKWQGKHFDADRYAQATGYKSGETTMTSWIMLPPIIVKTQKSMSFISAKAYWEHTGVNKPLEVVYSSDFNGSNMESATWTELTFRLPIESSTDHEWITSGNVELPVMNDKNIVIAFKYNGSDTESTSIRIDDIIIN
ncbi:DUF5689 domain-containing protein [Carboxylicivirga sp. N1Y90]|uniref:DUF5689 domain-containing protein n=1 Tax=Carboxylicivirga fragile TaxID=3417571 RepID=UPI003D35806F|nr:choice-of-anchor J domain-containing protein [Marinilabiliaceae bacterium N1Y90]